MENKFYFYDNHLGGWYKSTELYDEEELYCEACDDGDCLLNAEPMTLEEFEKNFPEYFEKSIDND